MVTALRSLLRFLHVTGRVPGSLVGAVPAVANWRLAGLPRGLSGEQVAALIEGCDAATPVGARNRALLVLLARLGLRTAEAAALQLEDVDWRSGQILIRGKGNRVEQLPLPQAVGEALVEYLTGTRPAGASPGGRWLRRGVRARPHWRSSNVNDPTIGAHEPRSTLAFRRVASRSRAA